MTTKNQCKLNAKALERILYILIIIGLAIYGCKDTAAAEAIIKAVKDAFSILIQ